MWWPLVPITNIKNKNLTKVKFWAPWGLLFGTPKQFFINYVIFLILTKQKHKVPCIPQNLFICPVLGLDPIDQYP